ncbi:MAG TPA: hypothetical protein VNQ14_13300 [Woeseiaceae bacterium]|nr:hypothetical protein [Woeseiaceae bacterium]
MAEPTPLVAARKHLSRAESTYRSADGLFHLEEGLALLEEVALDSEGRYRTIAVNLLSTYSTRICESIKKLVETDPGLPEPELEHLFKVLLAFDAGDLELPEYVRSLKIDVVKRLVDLYYEGHSAEEKQAVLDQLAGISGRGQ